MAFIVSIKYEEKLNSPGMFYVNPDHFRTVSGEDLVEVLSKFLIEVTQLQRAIYEEQLEAQKIERMDDDIPF